MKKLVLIVMLVAACSRREGAAGVAAGAQTDAAPQSAIAAGEERAAAMPRMIVRSADVRIVVADTARAVDTIAKSVESAGGYVSDSNLWRDGELLRAKLTLRVPAEKLSATLAAIRTEAKRVESETVRSEDASQEFVDLESRVRNLEATERELLELLTVARVSSRKAADVLEVHQQLTEIRGQIEQTRGRMRYLSQVTALSSIALDVVPDAIARPVVQKEWEPRVAVRDATRALVALLQNLATAAIWFVIYVAPILGMLALLIAALVKLARKSRTREA